jgi:hypothetical protein
MYDSGVFSFILDGILRRPTVESKLGAIPCLLAVGHELIHVFDRRAVFGHLLKSARV